MSTSISSVGKSIVPEILQFKDESITNLPWKNENTSTWTSIYYDKKMCFGSRKGEIIVLDTESKKVLFHEQAFSDKSLDCLQYLRIFNKNLLAITVMGQVARINFASIPYKLEQYKYTKPADGQLVGVNGEENVFVLVFRIQEKLKPMFFSQEFNTVFSPPKQFLTGETLACCAGNDKYLALGYKSGTVELLEFTPKMESSSFSAHETAIQKMFFSGTSFFTLSEKDSKYTIKKWDIKTLKLEQDIPLSVSKMELSVLSGKYFVSVPKDEANALQVVDLENATTHTTISTSYQTIRSIQINGTTLHISGNFELVKKCSVYSQAVLEKS